MIRLLKFRARFRCEIVTETKVALLKCLPEIVKSSPARVLEELFRMLESGSSAPFFQLMLESRLLEPLFPRIAEFMKGENGNKIFDLLIAADEINRTAGKKPLDRSQLLSCLLFPIFEAELKAKFLDKGVEPHLGQIQFASYDVIEEYILTAYNHFPRRISSMAAILMTNQFRLHPISGKKHFPQRFIRSRDFPDALLFLKIRATQDPSLTPLFNEWREHYQPHHHPPQRRPRHNAHRHS
jgi:poly(A) polymerase